MEIWVEGGGGGAKESQSFDESDFPSKTQRVPAHKKKKEVTKSKSRNAEMTEPPA